ncbi:MAG: DUF2269 family protein [Polyangiaceae bacterium]|jgi:uncharacterized membrane protein|nr:DUF2269 family protein [Polyangiaceae bacterium]
MYTLFLTLHVVSACVWFGVTPAQLVLRRASLARRDAPGEVALMGAFARLAFVAGNVGGIGIALSGVGLVWAGHLPWFAFGAVPWLATKQTLYVLILAINFVAVVPTAKRARALLGAAPAAGAGDEVRSEFERLHRLGFVIQALVFAALVLGVSRPSF